MKELILTIGEWLEYERPIGSTVQEIYINGRSIIGLYPNKENDLITVIFAHRETAQVERTHLIKVIFGRELERIIKR